MYQSKVDSSRLSIPLSECEVKNTQLTDQITTLKFNEQTGEQIASKTKLSEPIVIETKEGTYFKVYLDSQFTYVNGKQQAEQYLTILVNSKLLKKDYFTGITKDTFKDLYCYVMNTNTFMCSYDSFKNARYNDTDICFDFKSEPEDFKKLHKNFQASMRNPTLLHSVFNSNNKLNNQGFWTPSAKNPRDQATPSKPYWKFYSKQLDMESKSKQFAEAYLNPSEYNNVYRFECTISNSKHKKRLAISDLKTFWELLNSDLQSISKSIVNEYIDSPVIVKSKSMTPSKEVYTNLVTLAIEKGATLEDIRTAFELNPDNHNRVSINRFKKLYYELINERVIDLDTIKKDESTVSVFEYLGLK